MHSITTAALRLVPLMFFSVGALATVLHFISGSPTIPAERTESWWKRRHAQLVAISRKGGIDVLFLGDSITQGWKNNETWRDYYAPRRAANFGMYGDRTQNVLWRIQNGELEGMKPHVVVLMIGTNNLGECASVGIAAGIRDIVIELRERLPESKILLLGILPRSPTPDRARALITDVNERIAGLDDGNKVHFLDIGSHFVEPDGTISREIMFDFLHLSPKGYTRWAVAMEPTLRMLLGEDP